jgi:flagellar protein FliO/FliZ
MSLSRETIRRIFTGCLVLSSLLSNLALAQASKLPENEGAPLKVIFGLSVVLATIAGLAWLMKKFGQTKLSQQSIAKIVGGVNVGPREKVIVVEVAGRWLVVGVANGSVNPIANLDAPVRIDPLTSFQNQESKSSVTDLESNLTKYEFSPGNETQALANPALTSLFQKLIKKNH